MVMFGGNMTLTSVVEPVVALLIVKLLSTVTVFDVPFVRVIAV